MNTEERDEFLAKYRDIRETRTRMLIDAVLENSWSSARLIAEEMARDDAILSAAKSRMYEPGMTLYRLHEAVQEALERMSARAAVLRRTTWERLLDVGFEL